MSKRFDFDKLWDWIYQKLEKLIRSKLLSSDNDAPSCMLQMDIRFIALDFFEMFYVKFWGSYFDEWKMNDYVLHQTNKTEYLVKILKYNRICCE